MLPAQTASKINITVYSCSSDGHRLTDFTDCGTIFHICLDHVCNPLCTSSLGFWTSPRSSPQGRVGAGWWGLLCKTLSAEAPPASWFADESGAGTQPRMWSWLENDSQCKSNILMSETVRRILAERKHFYFWNSWLLLDLWRKMTSNLNLLLPCFKAIQADVRWTSNTGDLLPSFPVC